MKILPIALAVLCTLSVPTTARMAHAAPPVGDLELARTELERGHYAEAHRRFAQLADCGHREAARMALEMRQLGPQAYGMTFNVGPKRLSRWRALLAAPAQLPTQAGSRSGGACQPPPPPADSASDGQEYWRHHGVG